MVLDASAVLALLFEEAGAEVVRVHLRTGVIGAANLAVSTRPLLSTVASVVSCDCQISCPADSSTSAPDASFAVAVNCAVLPTERLCPNAYT